MTRTTTPRRPASPSALAGQAAPDTLNLVPPMKHLYDAATLDEVKARIARLRPDSQRQWGRMTVAQAVAHCAISMECAVGDLRPPRQLMGLLFARLGRPQIRSEKPMGRNVPTTSRERVTDERDLEVERRRLNALVDRFAAAGPSGCTTHPHTFFGPLTPFEWSRWMYKHLDHHLRQFQA